MKNLMMTLETIRVAVQKDGDKALRAYDKFVKESLKLVEGLEGEALHAYHTNVLKAVTENMPECEALIEQLGKAYLALGEAIINQGELELEPSEENSEEEVMINQATQDEASVFAEEEAAKADAFSLSQNTTTKENNEVEEMTTTNTTANTTQNTTVETGVNKMLEIKNLQITNTLSTEELVAFIDQIEAQGYVVDDNSKFIKVSSKEELDLHNEKVAKALKKLGLTKSLNELEIEFHTKNVKEELYAKMHNKASILSIDMPTSSKDVVVLNDSPMLRETPELFKTMNVKVSLDNRVVKCDNYIDNMFMVTFPAQFSEIYIFDFLYKKGNVVAKMVNGSLINVLTNRSIKEKDTHKFKKFIAIPGTASQSRSFTVVYLACEDLDLVETALNKGSKGILNKAKDQTVTNATASKLNVRVMANLTGSVAAKVVEGFAIFFGKFGIKGHELDGMNFVTWALTKLGTQNRPGADKCFSFPLAQKDMAFLIKVIFNNNIVFAKDCNESDIDAAYKGKGPLAGKCVIFADSVNDVQLLSDLNGSKAAFNYNETITYNTLEVAREMKLKASKQLLNLITITPEGRDFIERRLKEAVIKALKGRDSKEVLTKKEISSAYAEMIINSATDARKENEILNKAYIKSALKEVQALINNFSFELEGSGRRIYGDLGTLFATHILNENEAFAKGISGKNTVIRYPKASTGSYLVLNFLTRKELCERIDERIEDKRVREWLKRNMSKISKGCMIINSYKGTFQTLGGADMDFDSVFVITDKEFNGLVKEGMHKVTDIHAPAPVASKKYEYNLFTMHKPVFDTIASQIDSVGVITKSYEFLTALLTVDEDMVDLAYDAVIFGLAKSLTKAASMGRKLSKTLSCIASLSKGFSEIIKAEKAGEFKNVKRYSNVLACGPNYDFYNKAIKGAKGEYVQMKQHGVIELSEEIILAQIETFIRARKSKENIIAFLQDCDSFGSFDVEINIDGTKTGIFSFQKVALNQIFALYADIPFVLGYDEEKGLDYTVGYTEDDIKPHKVYLKDGLANIRERMIPVIQENIALIKEECIEDEERYAKEFIQLNNVQAKGLYTLRGIYGGVADAPESIVDQATRKSFYQAIGNTFSAISKLKGLELGRLASFVAQSVYKDQTGVVKANRTNAFNFKCLPQETAMKFLAEREGIGCIYGDRLIATTVISGKLNFAEGVACNENGEVIALAPGANGEREIKFINGEFYAVADYEFERTPNRYIVELKDDLTVDGKDYTIKDFEDKNKSYKDKLLNKRATNVAEEEDDLLAGINEFNTQFAQAVEDGKNILFFAHQAAESEYEFVVSSSNNNFTFSTFFGQKQVKFGHCANGTMSHLFDGRRVKIENAIQIKGRVYAVVSFVGEEEVVKAAPSYTNVNVMNDTREAQLLTWKKESLQ